MKKSDDYLGMDRPITRRDMLNGLAGLAVTSLMPPLSWAEQARETKPKDLIDATYYPPQLRGLRGNHEGSFEVSHQLARKGQTDWGPVQSGADFIYDLVVVGGGISGLSAAYFYRKKHPNAQILILENHDDFGGHAKRNEFEVNGRTLIGYGGAQTMQEPSGYSRIVKDLLGDLGVEPKVFNTAYDQEFFKRHKLGAGIHFDREIWGEKRMVPYDLGAFDDYIPVMPSRLSAEQAVDKMPISAEAKKQFVGLLTTKDDRLSKIPKADKWDYLYNISYRDFLVKHLGISQAEVLAVLQDLTVDSGVGIDSINAFNAMSYGGLPGWNATGLPALESDEAYIHHFPDGNASIARQLVRKMIPAVAPGESIESIITAHLDYSQLDQADAKVQLRLNSTVTHVQNSSDPEDTAQVTVSYVQNGQAYQIKARGSILACNSSMIPYLCPELPQAQREALAFQVKIPILYTTVALRNWKAWKTLGIGATVCPGSYHINAMLDFPVSLGDYRFSETEDQPVIVHMERFPHRYDEGLTAQQQYRLGRYELLTTPFDVIERNVRSQLQSMLGDGGFNAAEDIVGITVNRWSHGYSYWYNPLFDTVYDDDDDPRYPHMIGRKPFGHISIANADSAANAMMESAIEQAHRAVAELS
jgi:spermidine dehydrogenase